MFCKSLPKMHPKNPKRIFNGESSYCIMKTSQKTVLPMRNGQEMYRWRIAKTGINQGLRQEQEKMWYDV